MDGPFFRSGWNQPPRRRFSPSFRGVPVSPVHRNAAVSSPKVVSIPVHFVRPESTRSASALKIQKLFRGYLVRKSVKKIVCIKREVDEIERRISRSDTVDLIRKDAKERLRLNEALMALLFKLDSVRGVDSGVRDCRKYVIKKAIALQERLDAIVSGDQNLRNDRDLEVDDSEAFDQSVEFGDASVHIDDIDGNAADLEASIDNQAPATKISIVNSIDSENVHCPTVETEGDALADAPVVVGSICTEEAIDDDDPGVNLEESEAMPVAEDDDEVTKSQLSSATAMENPGDAVGMDLAKIGVETEEKSNESVVVKSISAESVANSVKSEDEEDDYESMDSSETEDANEEVCIEKQIVEQKTNGVEEIVETSPIEEYSLNRESSIEGGEEKTWDKMEIGENKDVLVVEGRDDKKLNREFLEKMTEDNEKMMSLMTQLFERNEAQTKMLTSLTQRVEQLEKVFISDMLRRKKKRH